jgi:hypothetical protein
MYRGIYKMSFFTQNKNEPKVTSEHTTFTTSVVRLNPSMQRGMIIIRATIDNQDSTNSLTFTKNGAGGTSFTIPPNSVGVIENEMISEIVVTPNATTGTGLLSVDMTTLAILKAGGFA